MLDRKIRKRIEWAFYNYDALKTLAAEYLVELAETGVTAQYGGAGIHSGRISNPTEVKGVKVAGNTAALWCKVVENTKTAFKFEAEEQLIQLKYGKKKSSGFIWKTLHLPESTYFYWLNRIWDKAAMWAEYYGL